MENEDKILKILLKLENEISDLKINMNNLNSKVDLIIDKIDKDVTQNCKKMSEHIDFIDNVYDNVKNPLGYICNKLNYFNTENYTLENIKSSDKTTQQD